LTELNNASIVATMLAHGVGTIATSNLDDFARFSDHVSVIGLSQ
jgi:predicted nucleic acid-binding protein